ncbi:hypothetical protein [Nonomuraea typhae]|uniref:hypothetical protein n=1 Tax=Nonomuraea typhae TaxID=2603600 RepID=UPI0012F7C3A3|nr:hypothetical protein [Nonomuraea typhae]
MTDDIEYDPYSHAIQENPYPVYAELRRRAPLYHNTERDFVALSRHADVLAAMRDPGLFSSVYGDSLDLWGPEAPLASSLIAMDAPKLPEYA